ncbi:hypothetical protein NUSPORA_02068 [Nucleospora cyclopteri]
MEKFSTFNDALTGENPFINPKYRKITFFTVINFVIKLPLFLLYKLRIPVVHLLIKINITGIRKPVRRIVCNSVTEFDVSVLRYVYGNDLIIQFPERSNSNNRGILRYKMDADYSIGLLYSKECIFMYGNKFIWLIRFLGNHNYVTVNCIKGNDLGKATGLRVLNLTAEDKIEFEKRRL